MNMIYGQIAIGRGTKRVALQPIAISVELLTIGIVRERVMSKWTVWAGGSEVNWQHYTHKIDAERVAEFWREVKGYDDVIVEEVA
jgi:hypothetical protein